MPQQVIVKMPDGTQKPFASMEAAQAALKDFDLNPEPTINDVKPPKAVQGVQGWLDKVSNTLKSTPDLDRVSDIIGKAYPAGGAMLKGAPKLGAGIIDMISHPVDNAPTIGAMAASGAAAALAPEITLPAMLLRTGAAAAGGGGGAALRGDDAGGVMNNAAFQGLVQGVFGELPGFAGRGLRSAGRKMVGNAMNPDSKVLGAIRNPTTGAFYPTEKEAGKEFINQTIDLASRNGLNPGTPEYAANLRSQTNNLRKQTLNAYANAPGAQIDPVNDVVRGVNPKTGIPRIDELAAKVASQGTDSKSQWKSIQETLSRLMNRQEPIQGAVAANGMPILRPRPQGPFNANATDDLMQGLQSELAARFEKSRVAGQAGQRPGVDFDQDVLQVALDNARDALYREAPAAQVSREANARLIPHDRAAHAAAGAEFGQSPQFRVAGQSGSSMPRLSLFDYIRPDPKKLAMPLVRTGQSMMNHAPQAPNAIRLLVNSLMNGFGQQEIK